MKAAELKKLIKNQPLAFRLALVLLALVMLSSLWALGRTFAATPSQHTLSYSTNSLKWDTATGIDSNGAAILDVFDSNYQNTVASKDGKHILAPGTEGSTGIKLLNTEKRAVTYTAYAYMINGSALPINVSFTGAGTETTLAQLPDGVAQTDILKVYTGSAAAGSETPFEISWNWAFEEAGADARDTALGLSGTDSVKIGFYLTVEDQGGTTYPETGDNGRAILYGSLFALCVVIMIILLKRDKEDEQERSKKAAV